MYMVAFSRKRDHFVSKVKPRKSEKLEINHKILNFRFSVILAEETFENNILKQQCKNCSLTIALSCAKGS